MKSMKIMKKDKGEIEGQTTDFRWQITEKATTKTKFLDRTFCHETHKKRERRENLLLIFFDHIFKLL
jgi:hypothetical protein